MIGHSIRSYQRVRPAPASHASFDRGVRAIVEAIRPTLGPVPRTVAVARPVRTMVPEILDDGASIARRITSIPDIHDNSGAMYLRGLLYRIREDVGDGTATAATLFADALAGGRRSIASGVPAQPLRAHLERLGDDVYKMIMAQARPILSRDELTKVARSACHDDHIGELLGDIFDVVGDTGQVDFRPSRRNESWRDFVQGSYWDSLLLSAPTFDNPVRERTDLYDAAIVVTNLALDDLNDVKDVLTAARATQAGGLLIVAQSVSPAVAGLLHTNSIPGIFPIVVVRSPVHDQRNTLDDLAIMTGTRSYLKEAGDSLRQFSPEDFGQARSAWAARQHFGIVAGQGDPRIVLRLIQKLETAHEAESDKDTKRKLLQRLGRLRGTSSTLWVGSTSDPEEKYRISQAERAALVVRHALRHGVVPGGGAALLHCQDALLAQLDASEDEIERAALRIVVAALCSPAESLLRNSGYEPASIVSRIRHGGAPTGYDVLTGKLGDAHDMGVVDPAFVVASATRTAIRSAALALTIDVLVHTRATEASITPE